MTYPAASCEVSGNNFNRFFVIPVKTGIQAPGFPPTRE